MKIVHLSYSVKNDEHDPQEWISKLSFFVGVLESTTTLAEVKSIHCISYSGLLTKNGVEYHFLKLKRWQSLLPFALHAYVKELMPTAIIVHGLIFPFQIIMLRWKLGSETKIICQHHAERPFKDIRKYIQRWADKYISAYLFCSVEQGLQWVRTKQIEGAGKIKEVMGTSSAFAPVGKDAAKLRTKVEGDPVYLWVGRLDNNKDPLTLARAFLRFQSYHPAGRLYMIYQTFELLDEVDALIRNAPNGHAIRLVGKIKNEELLYWYNSADFIVSSSHYEGSGVAVCEGLSCGCIPIVTNIPSFRMMTDNGQIGLLYDPGDVDGLADCLRRSLELDKKEMKQRVLQQFNLKLSFQANARQIVDVIHSIA